MEAADISWIDIDLIVFCGNLFLELKKDLWNGYLDDFSGHFQKLIKKLWSQDFITELSDGKMDRYKIYLCERDISYAASVFYASPFGEAAVISFIREGEQMIGIGCGNRFIPLKVLHITDSLEDLLLYVKRLTGLENICLDVTNMNQNIEYPVPLNSNIFKNIWIWPVGKEENEASYAAIFSYYNFYYRYRPFTVQDSMKYIDSILEKVTEEGKKVSMEFPCRENAIEFRKNTNYILSTRIYETPLQLYQFWVDDWNTNKILDEEMIIRVIIKIFEHREKRFY